MELADAIHQARELQLQERPDEALQLLLTAAAEHADDEDLKVEIAAHYADRGSRRLSLEDFDEADKWADLAETKIGRASVHCRRGEHERAEALLQEGLELEFTWAFIVLAEVRVGQARFAEAKEAVAKALAANPRDGSAYAVLAEALTGEGRADLAAEALEEGLRKDPEDERLLMALARSCRAQENLGRARRALEQAVRLNDHNVAAWRELAWVAAKDGDEGTMHHALENAAVLDREGTLAWIAKESSTLPELNAFGK